MEWWWLKGYHVASEHCALTACVCVCEEGGARVRVCSVVVDFVVVVVVACRCSCIYCHRRLCRCRRPSTDSAFHSRCEYTTSSKSCSLFLSVSTSLSGPQYFRCSAAIGMHTMHSNGCGAAKIFRTRKNVLGRRGRKSGPSCRGG